MTYAPAAAFGTVASAPTMAYAPAQAFAPTMAMPSYTPVAMMPSYTQAPVAYSPVHAAPGAAPARLLDGIPDPQRVEGQKTQYVKSIDDQLNNAQALLQQQHKQQMEYLAATAEQQKRQFGIQKDQERSQQQMAFQQQYNQQLAQLDDAAREQRFTLEHQSTQLVADYNQKKAQETLMSEQYALQKKSYDAQTQLHAQMANLQQAQSFMTPARQIR